MAPRSFVGRGDDSPFHPPDVEHAGDCGGREIRPVCQDDDGRLDPVVERGKPAAKRRPRPLLPVGAGNDPDGNAL